MVLRRCRQLLQDEDSALDAMHDVFARLLDQNHSQPQYPSSFLYTMATRICIDKLRSAEVRHGGNSDLSGPSPADFWIVFSTGRRKAPESWR